MPGQSIRRATCAVFAVKFYTQEGNWDLVGNNIPVFFIQDAIKFPDLIHAAKMEAQCGYPQAATAHDTFWDFISLMPESTHMIMWAMSDRTIPRSLRTIEGFGIHTFKLVNAEGKVTFVKFHWKPKQGVQSTIWDEAVKIAGADSDFHRRDLFEAIDTGNFPEWELGIQAFDQEFADSLPYDVLDPTKLIPEEVLPVQMIGRMVLDRYPDNFFAETEQVAFCPANIVPGVDFSNDPLLQGRLFSYLDTQMSRLGSANFHQLPINAAKCPVMNFQRDGHMQMNVPKGRANYEPNSLDLSKRDIAKAGDLAGGPRECPMTGFATATGEVKPDDQGDKLRIRPESFADHYSQARMFFRSMAEPEQAHLASALVFELSKVGLDYVRTRMLSNLVNVDETLAARVAAGINMPVPKASAAAAPVQDMALSPALRVIDGPLTPDSIKGRAIGVLVTDGADAMVVASVTKAIKDAGGKAVIISPKVGGAKLSDGKLLPADGQLAGTPSVLVDAIALIVSEAGLRSAAQGFGRGAICHGCLRAFEDDRPHPRSATAARQGWRCAGCRGGFARQGLRGGGSKASLGSRADITHARLTPLTVMADTEVQTLRATIAACRVCAAWLPCGPRPVVQFGRGASILIVSQAPGRIVHETGVPWNDASGDRLREWTALPRSVFYDPDRVALVPMGLCYPGRGNGADLPPRRECAPLWHGPILSCLNARLTLLVGQYAQNHYLPQARRLSVTERVRAFDTIAPGIACLPHPSWRSTGWMRRNPWFTEEIVPRLRGQVAHALQQCQQMR